MLTAKTKEGKLVVLTPELRKDQLRQWRKSRMFFCPQCETPVQLKVGDIVVPHFAHKKDASCSTLFSEGESQQHLQGKQQLYEFLQRHAKQVDLEPYLKMSSQRPDILVTTQSESIPIEFQCSTIPVADIESRSAGYHSAGMTPIWILLSPEKFSGRPSGVGMYQLSRFHESFQTFAPPEGNMLLTYNPKTKNFHYFTSLIHVAGKRYIGIHRTLPLARQIFPFARPKVPSKDEITQYTAIYLTARTQFLQSRILLNRRGVNNPFLRMCYEMRILPAHLPQWFGLPVPYSEAFREHDCEWQLAFFYYMRKNGMNLRELPRNLIREYVSRLAEPSKGKEKACIAYHEYLRSTGVSSSQKGTGMDEEKIHHLLSERFLAKRYEN
ncbi:competence protein CoiA [Sporosarcina sp. JAI121]|uniref:competence protein CoiA n=1 Tax=Sporosarcina sp. JAI121 TaxID=2723064 RepID=UPI00351A4A5E